MGRSFQKAEPQRMESPILAAVEPMPAPPHALRTATREVIIAVVIEGSHIEEATREAGLYKDTMTKALAREPVQEWVKNLVEWKHKQDIAENARKLQALADHAFTLAQGGEVDGNTIRAMDFFRRHAELTSSYITKPDHIPVSPISSGDGNEAPENEPVGYAYERPEQAADGVSAALEDE